MKEDRCVCCGEIVPEGRMICAECEKDAFKNVCNCYRVHYTLDYRDPYVMHKKPVCYGTKEQDPCSCGGDPSKCDFYPKKREEAMKAKEALALRQLKADAAKLGYRLIKNPEKVTMLPCPVCGRKRSASWYDTKQRRWNRACSCGFQGKDARTWNGTKAAWNEAVEEYMKEKEHD